MLLLQILAGLQLPVSLALLLLLRAYCKEV
jgi:hypothetical protein